MPKSIACDPLSDECREGNVGSWSGMLMFEASCFSDDFRLSALSDAPASTSHHNERNTCVTQPRATEVTLHWGRKISRLEPCARLTAYSSSKQTSQEPSHLSFTSCAAPVTHLRRPSASLSTSSRLTTEPRESVEGDSTSWHTTKRLSCRIRIVRRPKPTDPGGRQLPAPSANGENRRYVGCYLGSTRQSLAPSILQ